MGVPIAVLFFFLFLCLGLLANSSLVSKPKGPQTLPPFWESSFKIYQEAGHHLSHFPIYCLYGRSTSDFQHQQCEDYWDGMVQSVGLATLPFVILFFIVLVALDSLDGLYRGIRKKIKKGNADFAGTVTNPARASGDIFSWYFCLTPVTIEAHNKTQVKVYVSSLYATPEPGDRLAVFKVGSYFGEKRYLAMQYAPHVAVVSDQN